MKRTIEEKLLNPKPGSKAAAAKEFGIDLTLLIENLRLTPQQRVENLQKFEENVASVLKILTENCVEFVVVGETAGFFHGWKTIASKLEICYSRNDKNLTRIAQSITKFSPKFRGINKYKSFVCDFSTLRSGTNFNLTTDVGFIDLHIEVSGIGDYQAVIKNSECKQFFGFEVRILTIDGLIKAKTAAGRMKDLLILPKLEALREALNSEEN
jgi:hypothetical protein